MCSRHAAIVCSTRTNFVQVLQCATLTLCVTHGCCRGGCYAMHTYRYTTGLVRSKKRFLFGYIEVKMKIPVEAVVGCVHVAAAFCNTYTRRLQATCCAPCMRRCTRFCFDHMRCDTLRSTVRLHALFWTMACRADAVCTCVTCNTSGMY